MEWVTLALLLSNSRTTLCGSTCEPLLFPLAMLRVFDAYDCLEYSFTTRDMEKRGTKARVLKGPIVASAYVLVEATTYDEIWATLITIEH